MSVLKLKTGVGQYTEVALNPASAWYFEAFLLAASGDTARARLYDITADAAVANSEVTTTNTAVTRVRSSAITLVDGHDYKAQFGSTLADTGYTHGADLVGVKADFGEFRVALYRPQTPQEI